MDSMGIMAGIVNKELGFYLIIIGAVFMGLGALINAFQ